MIAFLHTRTLQGVLLLLAAAAVAGPARRSEAQSSPHFWRQREFFIPYQPNLSDPRAGKAVRVQLLLSRDDGVRWAVLQEAEPHVRGFSYLAPEDGSYAFAVRAVDRKGGYWPETVAQPALRIFVDTQPPTLELAASIDAVGQVVVRYEARDQRLNPETLRLEMQGDGGLWEPLSVGTPELSQPDRLLGRTQWRPPVSLREVRVRGTVADAAGNSISAATSASLTAGLIDPGSGPQLGPPGGDAAVDW
ncbi:MAG TPA: hypothetical protein PJ982_20375, partial [Lacipirellulaceae bacterium]|nr:hypothetical protein [Lacipirellulaceae bacterium]